MTGNGIYHIPWLLYVSSIANAWAIQIAPMSMCIGCILCQVMPHFVIENFIEVFVEDEEPHPELNKIPVSHYSGTGIL